jgi:hypothetical protein
MGGHQRLGWSLEHGVWEDSMRKSMPFKKKFAYGKQTSATFAILVL